MTQRLIHSKVAPALYRKFLDFDRALTETSLPKAMRHLVKIRVSQLNGCAFCVDMHVKEAKIDGERELRLYHLPIWRESPMFDPKERLALEWAETLTELSHDGVSDALYARAREQFSEQELCELTYAVMAINGWNRASIAFRSVPGSLDQALGLTKAGLS
ncbi:MAG: carboxymuconolactone decarboxylase family protein [Myxococcaceae bacterium]